MMINIYVNNMWIYQMRVKFITCIYSDLYGTDLGGRQCRYHHYRFSLLSLLKMTNADFLCYTSDREIESLKSFFYVENKVSENKLKFEYSIEWNIYIKFKIIIRKRYAYWLVIQRNKWKK